MQRPLPDRIEPTVDEVTSFEDFFESHRRPLFGALCLVTGNRSEAEEIMQDAFLKVWERWERVAGLEDPNAYLFRVAMNLFRNRLRRVSLAARKALALAPSVDDLATIEDRDEVVRWLRPLPPRQRAAIVLTIYLDYSSDEAARILGIRPSTVRALATQGRAGVRHALEEQA
jgi:RNA polymerase sigma-70 factor, ECF subfamily